MRTRPIPRSRAVTLLRTVSSVLILFDFPPIFGFKIRSSIISMDAESRDLLTVEQAANYLQLSQSSIRSYIRQGKLKAFRVAGKRKVLIPRDELLKLLEPARGEIEDSDATGAPENGGAGAFGRAPKPASNAPDSRK